VDHNQLGGVVSNGEFGSMLHHIFDPETETWFDWDHWGTLRGKRMYVFAFRVEQRHGYSMYDQESKREYVSAYKGLLYADKETRTIMRIKMDCVGIPSDYPIKEVGLTLDYAPTVIAGETYVLPFHMELDSLHKNGTSKNEADFKAYRRFGSESSITFEDTAPIPEDQLKEQPATPDKKPATPPKKP
jgi:hypothetical protein